MNPLKWFATEARLWGLIGVTTVLLCASSALGITVLLKHWKLKAAEASLTQTTAALGEANKSLGACQASQSQLRGELEYQNGRVRDLEEAGRLAEQAGLRRLQEAKAEAQRYRNQALAIARAQPSDPTNLCASAEKLIDDTLGGERAQ